MPGKRSSGGLPPGGCSASVEGRSTRLSKRCHGGPPPGGLPERVEQRCLDVSRTRPCNAAAASSLRAACLARRSALCLGCLHCPVNIARECCLRTALQRVLTGTATSARAFAMRQAPRGSGHCHCTPTLRGHAIHTASGTTASTSSRAHYLVRSSCCTPTLRGHVVHTARAH